MYLKRLAFFIAFFVLAQPVLAQQSASASQSSPQALAFLQQSLAALTGGHAITDVTLSGTAHRIAGSDNESGTATLKALLGTGSRLDLAFPSGNSSEVRNGSGPRASGSWSGPDAVSHAMSNHNLFTDSGWFPAFAVSAALSAPDAVITYVGQETRDGQSAIHITASQQFPALSGNAASLMRHLTQTDIFLNPNTNLPIALALNTHPDTNALLDLPVEILFSDYRKVNGVQIPSAICMIFPETR